MKYSTSFVAASIFAAGLLGGYRESGAEESMPNGILKMAEQPDGGGRSCSIPIKNGKWNLNDGEFGCSSDDYNYFKLDNSPSAVIIRFTSDGSHGGTECRWDGYAGNDWAFDIDTYKHPTTTGWVQLLDLKGFEPGRIIVAGVRLKQGRYESGDISDEVECVSIQVSDLP